MSDVTFGVSSTSLEEVATAIHDSFCYKFLPRSSSFLGGEYYASQGSREEVLVHLNKDGDDLAECDFPDCGILIQVNRCQDVARWSEFVDELGGTIIRKSLSPED